MDTINDNKSSFLIKQIDANPNLDGEYKATISMIINNYIIYCNKLGVNVQEENSANLFSSVGLEKLEKHDDTKKTIYYDSTRNVIVDNTINVDNNADILFDVCFTTLDMMCRKYDFPKQKYGDGIIYEDELGNRYGTKINTMLKEYIVKLANKIVSNEDDKDDYYFDSEKDKSTLEDRLLYDIQKYINSTDLLTYFINGEGILFYQNLCEKFDNNNECLDFLSTIDQYNRENSIDKRAKYDHYMEKLELIKAAANIQMIS